MCTTTPASLGEGVERGTTPYSSRALPNLEKALQRLRMDAMHPSVGVRVPSDEEGVYVCARACVRLCMRACAEKL